MKSLLILIVVVIFTFGCRQSYVIEKKLYDCIETSMRDSGIDLERELYDFEQYLIENGILKDRSGVSYYQIYKKIEKDRDMLFSFNYSLHDSISLHADESKLSNVPIDCFDKILTGKKYEESKLFKLENVMGSLITLGVFDVSNISNTITTILSAPDFEQSYYRMRVLLMLAAVNEYKTLISEQLLYDSDMIKFTEPIKERNKLRIKVTTDDNSVYLNDQKIAISDLTDLVKDYIIHDGSDPTKPELEILTIDGVGEFYQSQLVIILISDRNVKYKVYIEVQDQLLEAYNIVRNDMSEKYFGKSYDELMDEEIDIIKNLVPVNITEDLE